MPESSDTKLRINDGEIRPQNPLAGAKEGRNDLQSSDIPMPPIPKATIHPF